jgi:V/A-type H+-transporting ATPase subunit B
MYLNFGRELESRFISQGLGENRNIKETLDVGWDILSLLPEGELDRVNTDILKKYYRKSKEI